MAENFTWAIQDDVKKADLEGITDGLDDGQLQYWLGRAERAILAVVPEAVLDKRVEDLLVDKGAPTDVQVDLVLGKLANPGGVRTVQESNGPSSGSITYGGDSPGQLTLTADHRRMLGIVRGRRRAARTVATWG